MTLPLPQLIRRWLAPVPTCKTCHYWHLNDVEDRGWKLCAAIHEDSGIMVDDLACVDLSKAERDAGVRLKVPGGGLDMWTKGNFGCVLHRPLSAHRKAVQP